MNILAGYVVTIDRQFRKISLGIRGEVSLAAIVFDPIDGRPTTNVLAAGRSLGNKGSGRWPAFLYLPISLVTNAID